MPLPDRRAPPTDFDDWVRQLGATVYGVCRRLDPDPDDAYQAVWERAWTQRHRYDAARGEPRAWVLTVTHRLLVDRHRRRRARGIPVSLPELPDPAPAPGSALDSRQRLARLEQALRVLPEAQRRAVVLHHLQGLPLQTLAENEGVAIGTLKSRLHRGRARLLMLLED